MSLNTFSVCQKGSGPGAPASRTEYSEAAQRLHQYLTGACWDGSSLSGPDVGVRLNYRIGRFIKSYLPSIHWNDSLYYLQTQGYWVLANWRLFLQTGEARWSDIALRASEQMLARQRADGAWDYPNPEWRGRVATAEGTWGSIGLVETYQRTGDKKFLDGALRWHRFLLYEIGFERMGDELSVNYFSHLPRARVPNNTAFVLRFLAELANVTQDRSYLEPCRGLVNFMVQAQKRGGEFPYAVRGADPRIKNREHFQCYQYNAFQCLDLMRYHEITRDPAVALAIPRLLNYLLGGLATDGHVFFDCRNRYRRIPYHTAALGAALAVGERLGFGDHAKSAERAFGYLRRIQHSDGAFPGSMGDYRFLSDRRTYPRPLAMILFHFLLLIEESHERSKEPTRKHDTCATE